ncbi:hypothetical protein H6G17_28540 [Chroococcidiopsis sp. FACHB-1243]|uniref:hypothetical protein n=1 Tax=Chroococcidiopsis sp. [FACHB-1243] TaxID=2692781 RepID=UPI001781B2D0|nr:hypothetical protein [Chroococcidiopsis sp. [FACHB-1243]]MBD2309405.1 hypothetical protein [Chroococcidiopsis sp. [FACHB-1243]]
MIATEYNFDNFSQVLDRLDNFGLSPNQFRVYCHLFKNAVDGVVSESSESIARVCKLTRITVLRVLTQLAQMQMIQCDRAAGKKSVFYLMPCSNWRSLAPQENKPIANQQEKVVQLRANNISQLNSDTCISALQVNEINTLLEAEVPRKGTSALPANKLLNEIDVSNSDTGSLDEKLAAARERGWRDTGTWWNDLGQQVVTVNRFVVSVAEFMQRSLDSFDVGQQVCESGLRKCKEQIERIKQKKHQQLCDRVVAIAQIDNQLERGLCYG